MKNFFIILLVFTAIIATIQALVHITVLPFENMTGVGICYGFLFALTLINYLARIRILRMDSIFVGYILMGANSIKMIVAILFILPHLLEKPADYVFVLQFVALYFIFMAFEVVMQLKKTRSK